MTCVTCFLQVSVSCSNRSQKGKRREFYRKWTCGGAAHQACGHYYGRGCSTTLDWKQVKTTASSLASSSLLRQFQPVCGKKRLSVFHKKSRRILRDNGAFCRITSDSLLWSNILMITCPITTEIISLGTITRDESRTCTSFIRIQRQTEEFTSSSNVC